jgi:hypothetical protein
MFYTIDNIKWNILHIQSKCLNSIVIIVDARSFVWPIASLDVGSCRLDTIQCHPKSEIQYYMTLNIISSVVGGYYDPHKLD